MAYRQVIFEQEYVSDETQSSIRFNPKKWVNLHPRITCPQSFLGRIPFQLVMMATVLGLCFLSGFADAEVVPGTFDQQLDHANLQNHDTFSQRFWFEKKWYVPGRTPLVILYVTSFASSKELEDSGLTYWAQNLNAILYEIETRYTGTSFPNMTTSNLQYDTVDQHVQDLASFIANRTLVDNITNARWVVVGSLFDGAYSAWFRSKYPTLSWGSVSVSPFLVSTLQNQDYDIVYQRYVGTTCAASIHKLVSDISTAFKNSFSSKDKETFETQSGCPGNQFGEDAEFFFVMSQLIIGNLWDPAVCTNATSIAAIADQALRFDAFAAMLKKLVDNSFVPCEAWNIAKDTGIQNFRSSLYLMCSQLGQFQTAPASGNSLHPEQVDLPWYLRVCAKVFNNTLATQPNVDLFNAAYGGNNPSGCNMLFVTSTNDPFRSLGPDPTLVSKTSTTNSVLSVDCPDPLVNLQILSAPMASEQSCVTSARNNVLYTLQKWQKDSVACQPPHNNPNGDGDDSNVAAIVGPLAAIAGILVGVVLGGVVVFYATRAAFNSAKRYAWTKLN